MHGEIFPIYDSRNGHIVKKLHEEAVSIYVVAGDDLLPESEVFSHVPALVVPSKYYDIFGVVELMAII